jgi:predicted ATP-grasp superfamily ATP-dependent carboligase
MTILFVYEYCCALGLGREATDPAHSLYREGRAMRDAVAEDFRRMLGVQVETLDRVAAESEEREFIALARRADFTLLIAPETDRLLAQRRQWAGAIGANVLGSDSAALALTADKLALAKHWHDAGIRTPRTERATAWPRDRVPCVVKPRDGAGSSATFRVDTSDAFARCLAEAEREGVAVSRFVAQDFIPGRPASVAFLVGPRETIALPPTFQRLSFDGRFRYEGGELPIAPQLAARAVALGRAAIACVPGLRGYVGVDVILGDAADYTIEINPRLTTSYVGLRQLAGSNLAGAMLRVARGEPVGELAWKPGRVRFEPEGVVSHESQPGAIFS